MLYFTKMELDIRKCLNKPLLMFMNKEKNYYYRNCNFTKKLTKLIKLTIKVIKILFTSKNNSHILN